MKDNVYNRILNIVSLLRERENETGISVNEIAEVLNVPSSVVLNDIRNIAEKGLFGIVIVCVDEEKDNEDFEEELFAGLHNDEPISADTVMETDCVLTLNSVEQVFLKQYLEASSHPKTEDIVIKELYNKQFDDFSLFHVIVEALKEQKMLQMRYKPKTSEGFTLIIKPVTFVKFVDSNLYYLVAVVDKQLQYYRLDRIRKLEKTKTKYVLKEEEKRLLERFEYQWGMGSDETPSFVKLRVTKEANVYNKMRNELAYRKHGNWQIEEDYCYYTDMVSGINSFKAWLRKYGRSVMVVEPRWLAREIYEAALQKRERMEK